LKKMNKNMDASVCFEKEKELTNKKRWKSYDSKFILNF
jgi:hypothetical protein